MKHRYSHPAAYDYKKPLSHSIKPSIRLKQWRKRAPLIISLVLVLIFAGGGVAMAKRSSTVKAARQAALKTQSLFNQSLVSSFGSQGMRSATINAKLIFSGPAMPQSLNNLTIDGAVDRDGPTNLTFTSEIGGVAVSAQEISTDKTHRYSKISGFDDVDLLQKQVTDSVIAKKIQAAAPVIKALNNNWYDVDEQILMGIIGSATGGQLNEGAIRADHYTQLIKLYQAHQFLQQTKLLPDEFIDNIALKHAVVTIDKQTLQDFLSQAWGRGELDTMNEAQYRTVQQNIKQIDFTSQPMHVWFEKDTKYIRKVTAHFAHQNYNVTFEAALSNINKPVIVTPPSGALTTQQLLITLMPLMGNGSAACYTGSYEACR